MLFVLKSIILFLPLDFDLLSRSPLSYAIDATGYDGLYIPIPTEIVSVFCVNLCNASFKIIAALIASDHAQTRNISSPPEYTIRPFISFSSNNLLMCFLKNIDSFLENTAVLDNDTRSLSKPLTNALPKLSTSPLIMPTRSMPSDF